MWHHSLQYDQYFAQRGAPGVEQPTSARSEFDQEPATKSLQLRF